MNASLASMTSPDADLTTSIREGLELFFTPGSELEVRILKTPKKTISGCFNDLDQAVHAVEQAAAALNGNSTFYVTMNAVTTAVHARAANRLKPFADITTADADILRRRYFAIDCDPVRPAGVSSTDAELALALERREDIIAWLTAQGWPLPVRAMSGNGGHALYLIDLPNDDPSRDLVKVCLEVLHRTFQTATVSIDRTVYNAARICKLYGTVARKGDPTPERPHRRAEIEERPVLQTVTQAQLQALAARQPVNQPKRDPQSLATPVGTRLDMRAEFDARGWYLRELRGGWHAVRCPWVERPRGASGGANRHYRT